MKQLVLVAAPASRNSIEALLHEKTSGRWPRWVTFFPLHGSNKAVNDAELNEFAQNTDADILASSSVISGWVAQNNSNVRRFKGDELKGEVVRLLEQDGETWSSKLKALQGLSGAKLLNAQEWRAQFAKVDPDIGPRVAKALIAQLRVVRLSELAELLVAGGAYDYNVYFLGNDPHSGDSALVTPLAAHLSPKLFEASKLPALPQGAAVRLFSDGGWSGGETANRIKCITTPCPNKTCHVGPSHTLHVSLGFITKKAEAFITHIAKETCTAGKVADLTFSCSNVLDPGAGPGLGLAFADNDVNRFVDPRNPKAFHDFCKKVGDSIDVNRSLGTHGIASTVLFEHSLPKALLPLLMFGGAQVTAADGSQFLWKALLDSQHVQNPAANNPNHHCAACRLK